MANCEYYTVMNSLYRGIKVYNFVCIKCLQLSQQNVFWKENNSIILKEWNLVKYNSLLIILKYVCVCVCVGGGWNRLGDNKEEELHECRCYSNPTLEWTIIEYYGIIVHI